MSTREAILDEIAHAPDSLLREAYDFILFLKNRQSHDASPEQAKIPRKRPDFLARQKEVFGERILPDSQSILSESREERI